jgi:ComF family protein
MPDIIDSVLRWIYPVNCIACGGPADDRRLSSICRPCWDSIRPIEEPVCPRCGRPFDSRLALTHSPGHVCGACRERPPVFDQALSPYRYEGALEQAIRLFKYRGRANLARPLGDLALVWMDRIPACDLVVPVPLHPDRLREREYNQALLLADRIARRLNLPLSYDHLMRVRATRPQTELDRADRARNVRRAFAVRRRADLEGRRILLVDDVFTTGATANECAKTLRRAGVRSVSVFTLARRT